MTKTGILHGISGGDSGNYIVKTNHPISACYSFVRRPISQEAIM